MMATLCFFAGVLGIFSNEPERHPDIRDHFKYGSIGAEERAGVPYWIWYVLPELFPQHLPNRPGKGYERIGFVYESPSHKRPIGTSYRERMVPSVGLNCATCHTGTLREAPDAPRRIILGMPAHQFELQSYFRFFIACARDPGFTADRLIPAIKQANPKFSWLDNLIYRWFLIRSTKKGILKQARQNSWMESRPSQGPGRIDTFNPYKNMFGFNLQVDSTVGTADLPPLFHQKIREGMWLHWDGNNDRVEERNKSAAIGAGCSEGSLDLEAMKRVEEWIWELRPPEFPRERIDRERAVRGRLVYQQLCAECHAIGGNQVGQVLELGKIGTDPERVNSFTKDLAERMNTLGKGRPWKFSRFRKTNGYANMPLDGVWLRAPYLHNGAVPTLRDLLNDPAERPKVFYRGYDVYDYARAGFVSSGPEAERIGFRYDTAVRGNGNQGHVYGTKLKRVEKDDLLEYLKTL
jgi:mono/diheme cytochrome c family protein